jgi:hypothetical protein
MGNCEVDFARVLAEELDANVGLFAGWDGELVEVEIKV